ncbi:hypothetical protein RJO00_003759 [Enterobacter hormaechei]|nr:hypothetical protein [Enterobacter hormaechei]EKS6616485.1 hypothetical protein [Enterobacter hormaechei]EKW3717609.1 hypothetical protein [Enterobacter hormaechei]ELC6307222.1 hypothetical protein [Enterobacter hormaechei]
MSEAKPQDGTTVKGYRTLTPGDIERMNRLKGVSRHFCNLLDTEREHVNDELACLALSPPTTVRRALPKISNLKPSIHLKALLRR